MYRTHPIPSIYIIQHHLHRPYCILTSTYLLVIYTSTQPWPPPILPTSTTWPTPTHPCPESVSVSSQKLQGSDSCLAPHTCLDKPGIGVYTPAWHSQGKSRNGVRGCNLPVYMGRHRISIPQVCSTSGFLIFSLVFSYSSVNKCDYNWLTLLTWREIIHEEISEGQGKLDWHGLSQITTGWNIENIFSQ